jgi:DNA polymerase III sliding clamp (beta) subunit (PCNA family)
MKITITASTIRAASIAAAAKDIRYYLVGVHVAIAHREHATVYGTDGHILFAGRARYESLTDEPMQGLAITIPLETVKKCNKKADVFVLESLADGAYMIDGMRFMPLDGRFPDVQRVITRHDAVQPAEPSIIDPELITRGQAAIALHYGAKKSKVYPMLQQGSSAALIHNGMNDAVCVVMPMRIESQAYQGFQFDLPAPIVADEPHLKAA